MPTLAITHSRWNGRPLVSTSHTPADGATQSNESRYSIGWDAPHYPVPALLFLAYDWRDNVSPINRFWQP